MLLLQYRPLLSLLKFKFFATDAGYNETATTTVSTFAMSPSYLKVEDIIEYNDKVSLSLWKIAIDVFRVSTSF